MQSFAPTGQLSGAYPQLVEGPNPRTARDEDITRLQAKLDTWVDKRDFLHFDPRADEYQENTMDFPELTEYTHSVHAMIDRAHDHGVWKRNRWSDYSSPNPKYLIKSNS